MPLELSRLREPFAAEDVEWRIGQAGKGRDGKAWAKVLAYITSRAIQDRLDEVCGPENWCNEFAIGPGGGVLCGIAVRVGDEWVRKWDGAENTDIEAVKGGLSGAMKRAAVQWGIGRYLYDLPEGWAVISERGAHRSSLPKDKGGDPFRWDPPQLPAWALPRVESAPKPTEAKPSKAERFANRIRELAIEVDTLRDQKKVDLTLRPAASDAEDFLSAPDCNTAIMEKYGNKLGTERDRLAALPDPSPGYDTYVAPGLDEDAGEPSFDLS